MRKKTVLDSWAVICYFQQEPGHDEVIDLLQEAADRNEPLLMTAVNWGEVLYSVKRKLGESKMSEIESLLDTLPIEIHDIGKEIAREAAGIKANIAIAYADCFAVALAKVLDGKVVTGDPEFVRVESLVPVRWIGHHRHRGKKT